MPCDDEGNERIQSFRWIRSYVLNMHNTTFQHPGALVVLERCNFKHILVLHVVLPPNSFITKWRQCLIKMKEPSGIFSPLFFQSGGTFFFNEKLLFFFIEHILEITNFKESKSTFRMLQRLRDIPKQGFIRSVICFTFYRLECNIHTLRETWIRVKVNILWHIRAICSVNYCVFVNNFDIYDIIYH